MTWLPFNAFPVSYAAVHGYLLLLLLPGLLHDQIRRVAGIAGDRLVWGSDWPHTAFDHDALPPYDSVWQPVVKALGAPRAAAVRAAGALLYA